MLKSRLNSTLYLPFFNPNSAPPLIVGVNALVIGNNGRIWLGMRRGTSISPNTWGTPGGHVEKSETPIDAAIREVREETGVKLIHATLLGCVNGRFEDINRPYLSYLVIGKCYGVPEPKEPERCEAWYGYEMNHLPSPLFPPLKQCLSEIPYIDALQRFSAGDFTIQASSHVPLR